MTRWGAAVGTIIALIVAAAPPAGAYVRPGAATDAPARPASIDTSTRQLIARTTDAVEGNDLVPILRAAGIRQLDRPAPGPALGLPDAIATLEEAVEEAGAIVRRVLPTELDPDALRMRTLRSAIRGTAPPDPLGPAQHRAVDRAAAIVAAAIDATLPQMVQATSGRGSGDSVDGCDVVDQAPALCVAGYGDNVINDDYALVVDLGGDDLHAHSAGGAEPLSNGLPVAVTIDLSGNDRYDTPIPTASGAYTAQGSGYGAGVGFLIDAAGDDTYRIAPEGPYSVAIGQGKGEHGFGLLADMAGNDDYELSATGDGGVVSLGHGDGANGVGILIDREGDDRHAVLATATGFFTSPIGQVFPPAAVAYGIGAARTGYISIQTPNPIHFDAVYAGRTSVGLFVEGGGSDELTVAASIPDPDQDDMFGPKLVALPIARSTGIGHGAESGLGLAILGEGDTDAFVGSSTRVPAARAEASGMGVGTYTGIGVLADAGGDDTRTLSADVEVSREAVARAGCGGCDTASAQSRSATIEGMGFGLSSGAGFLHDDAGNDRYIASVTNVAEATFHDERAEGGPGAAVANAGPVRATVQGVGDSGPGELIDAAGDDRYEVTAGSRARSTATGDGGAAAPQATAVAGDADVMAQAAASNLGSGRLIDLGGSDTYLTTSSASAEADPSTTVEQGAASAGVLASVDTGSWAVFTDADAGADDGFEATPASPACTGTRGQDAWTDCGGAGAGLMA